MKVERLLRHKNPVEQHGNNGNTAGASSFSPLKKEIRLQIGIILEKQQQKIIINKASAIYQEASSYFRKA